MILRATRATMLGLSMLPMLAAASVAEPPSGAAERFTMSPIDGGFLRLDKQTGAVAMCAKSGNEWACKPIDDQTGSARPDKLSRLESENRDLKARVKELEDMIESRPPGGPPPPPGPLADAPSPDGKVQLPTDEEVDQALDYISRVYKKIRDHVRDLDKPLPPDDHAAPPPPPAPPAAPGPKGSL